jgi:hypothetical protein
MLCSIECLVFLLGDKRSPLCVTAIFRMFSIFAAVRIGTRTRPAHHVSLFAKSLLLDPLAIGRPISSGPSIGTCTTNESVQFRCKPCPLEHLSFLRRRSSFDRMDILLLLNEDLPWRYRNLELWRCDKRICCETTERLERRKTLHPAIRIAARVTTKQCQQTMR